MAEETQALAAGDTATVTTDAGATTGTVTPAADSDWSAALDADTRKTIDAKGWKTPIDAVKGALKSSADHHRELTEVRQHALLKPGADAKPEDVDAFYSKLGRPEKADGYSFKLPDGIPEAFPYDETSAVKFKNWAHKAGLAPEQAQALHDEFVRDTAGGFTASALAAEKATETAHQAIVKVWGEPETEAYKRHQELANRALRQQGGSELIDELKSIGALGANGEVKTPRLAIMLSKIGADLYAEDTLYAGPGNAPNPFSEKSEDMGKQGDIIRKNPDHARALIRAAGFDPKEWSL